MAREERQHKIQLVILRQADDDIRLGDALLRQQINICTVSADRKARCQLLCEQFAALTIAINDLYLHALALEHQCKRAARPSCTDDGGTRQFMCVARHETLAELLDAVGKTDEVGIVTREKYVIAVRDNHTMIAKDQPCKYPVRELQLLERFARDGRAAADARLKKAHLSLCEILYVERSGRH